MQNDDKGVDHAESMLTPNLIQSLTSIIVGRMLKLFFFML